MFRSILTLLVLAGLLLITASLPTAANAQPDAERDSPQSSAPAPQPDAYTGQVTGPQTGAPVDIALQYVRSHAADLGLATTDTTDLAVGDVYTDAHNGVTHVYITQHYQGLDVYNAQINLSVMSDGSILYVGNRFAPHLAKRVNTTQPTLTAEQAVRATAAQLGLQLTAPLSVQQSLGGPDQAVVFSTGGISQNPIPAKLVYVPLDGGEVVLAWNVNIYQLDSLHWWDARVDATSGKLVSQSDWVVNENRGDQAAQSAHPDRSSTAPGAGRSRAASIAAPNTPDQYRVYPWPVESPIHTSPVPPADGRVLAINPAQATASPFGWHDTNGAAGAEFTTTEGNNVSAYTDTDGNNVPDPGSSPSGGASLNFDFPIALTAAPSTYRPAAVTNLFYWNNLMHDVQYLYGFTEAAGSFQVNNYGRGGTGNDPVDAEAQDGSGTNNANFATPPDGSRPRMQMYLWTLATPNIDGDLDSGVISHEYGHGISNRLTGGPSNTNCLGNAEQMGEGWSDWLGLFMTMKPGDTGPQGRGIGTYVMNQPATGVGVRPARYSTDLSINNYTYANIGALSSSQGAHGVGFVWATMLWDMNWKLIDKYGFNPNIYGAWNTGGNNLANQLILDGMKIQPCSPGFVDGRNAILAADQALTGGTNQCLIWGAFARRGLGFSASQGSSSSTTDGTAAFDIPASCGTVSVTPPTQNICLGQPATYTVGVGLVFTAPVTLSAAGHPVNTTILFGANPVTTLPTTTLMTVGNTGAATAGNYTITITATDAFTASATSAQLKLFDFPVGAPVLTNPPNGATDLVLRPTLTWTVQADANAYDLEMAIDPAFTSVVYTATVNANSHIPSVSLAPATRYYWRIAPRNACGHGAWSTVSSFTTALILELCSTPNTPIADNTTFTSTLNSSKVGKILDLNVSISGTHTWVGDLSFTLIHSDTGKTTTFVDRPGVPASSAGCANNNFDPLVDDEGVDGPVETQCRAAPTALFGNPTPNNPLSVFDGDSLTGAWLLRVSDSAGGDTGTLQRWCVSASVETPKISLTKTAGTDPAVCAAANTLNVLYGSPVTYCYMVTNTGTVTVTNHTLEDDQLGTLFSGLSSTLAPGASTFVTNSVLLTQTTINTAQWLASDGVFTATATSQATVTVGAPPAIELAKTVGTDSATCAASSELSVPYGANVTYCYTVTNTGGLTLSLHTLADDQLGTLLNNLSYNLAPGASTLVTHTTALTATATNLAHWTAGTGVYTVTASAQATVTVGAPPAIGLAKTVGTDPATCAASSELSVPYGANVTYCYKVINTGGLTLSLHTLADDQLGTLLNNLSYDLAPGASTLVTHTTALTATATNLAHWTAGAGVYTVTASAQATVTVGAPPAIELAKTVGTDPATCAASSELSVPYGANVTYCYKVTNTGGLTLSLHTLADDQLGTLLSNLSYDLAPGASTLVTHTTALTATATNLAHWTAGAGVYTVTASAQATVTVGAPPTLRVTPLGLSNQQAANLVTNQTLTISNTGGATLQWSLTEHNGPSCASPDTLPWVSALLTGTLTPGSHIAVPVSFDSTGLSAGATYTGTLCLTSNDPAMPQVGVSLTLHVLEYRLYLPLMLH